MSTYTTKQGDMWDSIAYTQCGSSACTMELMELNPQYHGTYIFPAGCVLQLPEDGIPDVAEKPPWKRGAVG